MPAEARICPGRAWKEATLALAALYRESCVPTLARAAGGRAKQCQVRSMIVACPSCKTRFNVPDTAFPADGRKVKCSNCGEVWHQRPSREEPAPEDDLELMDTEPSHEPEEELQEPTLGPPPVEPQEAPEPEPEPAESEPPRRRRTGRRLVAALALLLVAGAAGAWFARAQIVAVAPAAAPAVEMAEHAVHAVTDAAHHGYEMVAGWVATDEDGEAEPHAAEAVAPAGAGLELRDVNSLRRSEAGGPVLVVEGMVANVTDRTLEVPQLRLALVDAEEVELQVVEFMADDLLLEAGAMTHFSTVIDNPDEGATALNLTFSDTGELTDEGG